MLAPTANQSGRVIPIEAPAMLTDPNVLTLGTKKQEQSIIGRAGGYIKQRKQDMSDGFKQHKVGEIIEKWAVGQLPCHPNILWSDTRFNADFVSSASVPDTPHAALVVDDLSGRLPQCALHACFISPLTSETAKDGDPVEAIITQPLLSADGSRLLVPEGTYLHGVEV